MISRENQRNFAGVTQLKKCPGSISSGHIGSGDRLSAWPCVVLAAGLAFTLTRTNRHLSMPKKRSENSTLFKTFDRLKHILHHCHTERFHFGVCGKQIRHHYGLHTCPMGRADTIV